MATGVSFHGRFGYDYELDITGKGLGFFGPQGSGSYVQKQSWQDTSYTVNGEVPHAQLNNVKYIASNSGVVGPNTLLLTAIPNYQATLNIRFEQASVCKVLWARCSMFDGEDTSNAPLGWNTRIAEIAHTGLIQDNTGVGDATWHVASTGEHVNLHDSPGPGGSTVNKYVRNGSTRHDWYIALSVSPNQVGHKHAGLYVYLEYL